MNRPIACIIICLALILLTACGGIQPTPTPTQTPTLVASSTPTIAPSATPPILATATQQTATPEGTEEPTPIVITLEALTGEKIPPPLEIVLPSGWAEGYDTMQYPGTDAIYQVRFAAYSGPVTGGTATIVLLWGFPSLTAYNPLLATTPQPDLWADGLRLLRGVMFDMRCNIGMDLQRTYRVGGLEATGTQFAAVDCPGQPDTRGWFAGLHQNGLNFVFYIFADPIEAMNVAQPELQGVLDSVVFRIPDLGQ